jgi:hypothetical protein
MSFLIHNVANHLGADHGHCVGFLQVVGKLPHTSQWRRGAKVRGVALAPGTCIATFGPDGRYENRTDGASHAAVLVGEEDVGLAVIDCWAGHPVARRILRWRDGSGDACNDGDQFYVIEGDTHA